jgi:hypothetical protein
MAARARLSAVRANNAEARREFLRLAEKFEAVAVAEDIKEVPRETH